MTGRLVEPDDVAGLAATLAEMLSDRMRTEAMGRAGYERASRKFRWETCGRAYETLFSRLVHAALWQDERERLG